MSLKVFHLFFMIACIAMSLFVGGHWIWRGGHSGDIRHLAAGIGAVAFAVLLLWYSRWVLRKLKGMKP